MSGGEKGDAKFWNVATGKELFSLTIPSAWTIGVVKFSPDGRTLVLQDTHHILRASTMAEIEDIEAAKR